mgnify:CR=1 FL=1|jgi:hypothetical protein
MALHLDAMQSFALEMATRGIFPMVRGQVTARHNYPFG